MFGQRLDVSGAGYGPRQFGLMQDVDITFTYAQKELYGQQQFAAAIARGQGKVTGKAKVAQINVLLYADIFFGLQANVGSDTVSQDEANTIPNLAPFQITPAHVGPHFAGDLGVWMAASGERFNTATTPNAHLQYSVDANGVYTFSAVDANQGVRISYLYYQPSTGMSIPITNQTQGYTPAWKCTIFQKISPTVPGGLQNVSLPWTLELNACVSNSLSFPTSQDNWTLNAFDFSAFADASGTIGIYNAVSQ
jgi:hypothetical protein